MQTDRTNKIFSILKNTSDSLVLRNGEKKFIRKSFVLEQETLKQLVQRQNLSHANLINLYQIEFSHQVSEQKFAVEMIYEHFCRTLEQCVKGRNTQWEEQQVINTFQPVIDVIEYLIQEKCHISDFSSRNIVITQSQDIKYIDSFFFQKEIDPIQVSKSINNFNEQKVYEKIAQTIFSLVFPRQTSKSWKNRMKILKQRSSKQFHIFLSAILSKSLSKGHEIAKIKKIRKCAEKNKKYHIQDAINKCPKEQRREKQSQINCTSNLHGKPQGKENMLQQ